MPWKTESAPGSGASPWSSPSSSLMLLTFLGLTLATTTSTELQIATNYRWSQQALYNAEAGLEAARIVLSNVADIATQWTAQLPAARRGPWAPGRRRLRSSRSRAGTSTASDCDTRGGMGYGRVAGRREPSATRTSDASTGQTLNGAFTIWIRRPLRGEQRRGVLRRHPATTPSSSWPRESRPTPGAGDAFTRAAPGGAGARDPLHAGARHGGRALRLGTMQGQEGGSPMGENFNPCAT